MTITTISSRALSQDAGKAKKAARNGPVFITDRGRPAHVLLTIEEYRRMQASEPSIADLLASDDDIDFEAPKLDGLYFKSVEFD